MKSLLILSTIFYSSYIRASSCCGGGSSSSLIITGDNDQEISLGLSFKNDLGQTDSLGWATFHDKKVLDQQSALNLQYQRQLLDQWQISGRISMINKRIYKQGRKENKSGLGDLEIQGSFEFLPEREFSPLKPRGFIFSKISFPNSKSLYNSESEVFSDVRGPGLYSLSIGSFFLKRLSEITLKAGNEFQHFFGKNFKVGTLKDYNKLSIPLGISVSFDTYSLSWGVNSTWNFQEKKQMYGAINSTSGKEYFWETGTFVNYSVNREESVGLSYADSTLIGKNINSSLYRVLSLNYTHASAL